MGICDYTGMPMLWSAKDFRLVAKKVGFINMFEEDITGTDDLPWDSDFRGYLFSIHSLLVPLIQVCESIGIVRTGYSRFYEFVAHSGLSFMKAADLDIITCTVMMTWTKPNSDSK